MSFYFLFTAPPTPEIYTLSLHDALPICHRKPGCRLVCCLDALLPQDLLQPDGLAVSVHANWHQGKRRGSKPDRKSTRLNSSHVSISYAVFCLKKKKKKKKINKTI